MLRRFAIPTILAILTTLLVAGPASAMTAEVWFPVQQTEGVVFHDNYGDCRAGCARTHRGVDVMAPQMTEVYAAESGYIRRAYGGDDRDCFSSSCSSYGFLVYGDDGNSYFYLHLNNDTPGRPNSCDGRGGPENAFGKRLSDILAERGTLEPLPNPYSPSSVVRVEKGELIGYVGSSGNAGCGTDHLHYEMWAGHKFYGADDSRKSDPYPYLKAALDAGRYWGPEGVVRRPDPESHGRVAGTNRVETSVKLSAAAFESAETVVIAPAEVYPEALVAAPLGATMEAPVLLTWNNQAGSRDLLDDVVAAEIERLGATYAVIVGDESRFGAELEQQLAEKTSLTADDMRRIRGADRFELSENVAEQIAAYHGMGSAEAGGVSLPFSRKPSNNEAAGEKTISPVLALGQHEVEARGWPDALASSSLAARQTVPVLLAKTDELPEATKRFLSQDGIGEVRIVGGTAAISQAVEDEINAMGLETRRLSGPNRFATSLAVAEESMATTGAKNSRVWVATGANYPDALASGQTVASLGNVLVLVDGANKDGAASVFGWLRDNADSVARLEAIGGQAVVSDQVLDELAIHANWPR